MSLRNLNAKEMGSETFVFRWELEIVSAKLITSLAAVVCSCMWNRAIVAARTHKDVAIQAAVERMLRDDEQGFKAEIEGLISWGGETRGSPEAHG